MMTSARLERGIEHISKVLDEVRARMEEREYESIHEMQGSTARRSADNPSSFPRVSYIPVLSSYPVNSRVRGQKDAPASSSENSERQ
jgi:dihydroorotate dehydrogenase (fumarate)